MEYFGEGGSLRFRARGLEISLADPCTAQSRG